MLLLAQTLKTAGVSYWLLVQQGCVSSILALKNIQRLWLDHGQSGQAPVTLEIYGPRLISAEVFNASDRSLRPNPSAVWQP